MLAASQAVVCSQKRITVGSDVKLMLRRRSWGGTNVHGIASTSVRTRDVRVADGPISARRRVCDVGGAQDGDCDGCESNSRKLPCMWWLDYAPCRHVYRWCRPPSRVSDITSAFTPGRGSTLRWFGVSFSSAS